MNPEVDSLELEDLLSTCQALSRASESKRRSASADSVHSTFSGFSIPITLDIKICRDSSLTSSEDDQDNNQSPSSIYSERFSPSSRDDFLHDPLSFPPPLTGRRRSGAFSHHPPTLSPVFFAHQAPTYSNFPPEPADEDLIQPTTRKALDGRPLSQPSATLHLWTHASLIFHAGAHADALASFTSLFSSWSDHLPPRLQCCLLINIAITTQALAAASSRAAKGHAKNQSSDPTVEDISLTRAHIALHEAATVHPEGPLGVLALFLLGCSAFSLGEIDKAASLFNLCLEIFPASLPNPSENTPQPLSDPSKLISLPPRAPQPRKHSKVANLIAMWDSKSTKASKALRRKVDAQPVGEALDMQPWSLSWLLPVAFVRANAEVCLQRVAAEVRTTKARGSRSSNGSGTWVLPHTLPRGLLFEVDEKGIGTDEDATNTDTGPVVERTDEDEAAWRAQMEEAAEAAGAALDEGHSEGAVGVDVKSGCAATAGEDEKTQQRARVLAMLGDLQLDKSLPQTPMIPAFALNLEDARRRLSSEKGPSTSERSRWSATQTSLRAMWNKRKSGST